MAGDPVGAVTELESVLIDRLRVLGPNHRDTLITRSDIGHWRGRSGDPVGAVEILEALLSDRVRVLGPDHPDTTATQAELEIWRNQPNQKTRFSR
jgi:Tetratricopeptide repeat